MTGPGDEELVGSDPVAAIRECDDLEARMVLVDEFRAEVAIDGAASAYRRALDGVLGVPAGPEFLELGDGRVLELGGDEDPPPTAA